MKKIITALILVVSIMLCFCFSAVALIPENKDDIHISIDSIFNPDAPVYSMGISVLKLPDKIRYVVGEEFNSSGIKIISLQSDGTTELIDSGYTFSGFDSSTIGVKPITVTYGELTTSFNVYVVLTAEDDSQTEELKWSLKFLNNNGEEITSAKALESFWVSVSFENYKDVFGNMTAVGTDYTASAFNNTLNSFLNIFYYDNTKMSFDSEGGIYNPYEDLGYDIDFYNDGGRFVYLADANFKNIGLDDLVANNGELFRVKFKNINSEYRIPAYISFVASDVSESSVTILNKPQGEALSVSHYIDTKVLGYSNLYGIDLGVSKYLSIAGAGVAINRDQLSLEAYVNSAVAEEGYDDFFVRFKYKGKTVDVKTYREEGAYYVYKLSGIEPDMFTEPVVMSLYVSNGGELANGATYKYSISTYCYDMLGYTSDSNLKTLLVDLLNYGSSVQTYTGNENELANAELTEAQKALGTDIGNLSITKPFDYQEVGNVDDPAVTWNSAWVDLNDSVDILFKFKLSGQTSTDNLALRISTADGFEKDYNFNNFVKVDEDGFYTFKFDRLDITQMRTLVSAKFLQNGEVISNTLNYSIESYAADVIENSTNSALKDVVRYMLAYGDSVNRYLNG